jgi:hypothetical protein
MAFTTLLVENDGEEPRSVAAIICDGCRAEVGWNGRVIQGERWTDENAEDKEPGAGLKLFTNIGPSGIDDDQPEAPYVVAVACSAECHAFLLASWDMPDAEGNSIPTRYTYPPSVLQTLTLNSIRVGDYIGELLKWAELYREAYGNDGQEREVPEPSTATACRFDVTMPDYPNAVGCSPDQPEAWASDHVHWTDGTTTCEHHHKTAAAAAACDYSTWLVETTGDEEKN